MYSWDLKTMTRLTLNLYVNIEQRLIRNVELNDPTLILCIYAIENSPFNSGH